MSDKNTATRPPPVAANPNQTATTAAVAAAAATQKPRKTPSELEIMRRISGYLDQLSAAGRRRVMNYLNAACAEQEQTT